MRPLSFQKGKLLVLVPDAVAAQTGVIEFRRKGSAWALQLTGGEGCVLLQAAGTYQERAPESPLVAGNLCEGLPGWWDEGVPQDPDPWAVAEMFGVSATPVALGSDA